MSIQLKSSDLLGVPVPPVEYEKKPNTLDTENTTWYKFLPDGTQPSATLNNIHVAGG